VYKLIAIEEDAITQKSFLQTGNWSIEKRRMRAFDPFSAALQTNNTMSNWWDEAISTVPIAAPKVLNTCTPSSSSSSSDNEGSKIDSTQPSAHNPLSFHGITVKCEPHPGMGCMGCIQEESRRVLIKLENFTGTIELVKSAPPSRFTSSFNVRIDEVIPKPVEMPAWLTEAAVSPSDAASKRKANEKPYEYLIPRKVARVTTPDASADWDRDAHEVCTAGKYEPDVIRYGMNRSGHVAWLGPNCTLCIHGGTGDSGNICADILHLNLHGKPVSMATVSRPLCEPQARTGHTALRLPGEPGLLVMFAGITTSPSSASAATAGAEFDADADADADADEGVGVGVSMSATATASDSVEKKTITTDALLVLDLDTDVWYPPAVSGKAPTSRAGHSAALLLNGRAMVVYGGENKGRFPHNIHWLDTSRWHWNSPKCDGKPPRARAGHCCYAISSPYPSSFSSASSSSSFSSSNDVQDLVIFGGHDDRECFNDVHVLRCAEKKSGSGTCTWEWIQPEVRGLAPCMTAAATAMNSNPSAHPTAGLPGLPQPRTAFASCAVGGGRYLFIRGGRSWGADAATGDHSYENELQCSDAFLLDMWEWVWYPVPISGMLGSTAAAGEIKADEGDEGGGRGGGGEGDWRKNIEGVCGVRVVVDSTAIDSFCPPEEQAFSPRQARGYSDETASVLTEDGEEFVLLFGGVCEVAAHGAHSPAPAAAVAAPLPLRACATVTKIRVKSMLSCIHIT